MRGPIKTRFDGVHVPERPRTQSSGPIPENPKEQPRQHNNYKPNGRPSENANVPIVLEPIPVDVRKPRSNALNDVPMGDPENPRGKRLEQIEKKSKVPEKTSDHHDKSRSGPRQSELKTQVDVSAVLDEILDTPVPLTIQKILGTSKELSHGMHDRVKFKNQSRPVVLTEPGRSLMSHNVNSQTMRGLSKYQSEAAKELIRMTFYCHGHPITAVIDTGSEINVVNSTIATERIPLPMDTRSSTTMADANGGEGYLKGLINGVPLTCGAVKTVCDMFVGDTIPFDLLLGRPWQIHNKVTIDK